MESFLIIFISSLAAVLAVKWSYFKILKIAKEKNLVDNPDARKLQKNPVPVTGGLAVFTGILAGILTASSMIGMDPDMKSTAYLLPVLISMGIMLYTGAMDDIIGLTPRSRFIIEILVVLGLICSTSSCVNTLHGVFGVEEFSWWIGVPLTVFAGVGVINAINMIDGVNGLSSGLCMACSLLYGIAFLWSGDISNALLAFVMAASLLPFYIHNVFGLKSRMFIGDAGTMVMGILMTWFFICVLREETTIEYYTQSSGVGLAAMCIAFLSVPVFDTLRVMTMRMIHGRSPFSPDKTHLHHAFISSGISHFITSTTIILIDLVISAIWVVSVYLGADVTMQVYIVIAFSMLMVWGTYAFIRYNEMKHTAVMHWLSHFSVSTHMGRKEWWKAITRWLDAPEEESYDEIEREHLEHLHSKYFHKNTTRDASLKCITDYIKGKAEVHVKDILVHSGAIDYFILPILEELEQQHAILVVKRDEKGTPTIVAQVVE